MKLALIRQRYTPFGGAERFVARAMEALKAEGTQLTIVTRSWQSDDRTPAIICNPPYLGSVWRDWSFARCVCDKLAQHDFDLVQSHERIACCDIYRAGDGVHREWLHQRQRTMGLLGKVGIALNPYHRYVLQAEKKLFESTRLKAVICISNMVKDDIRRHFRVPENKLHVIYNGMDTESFHPRLKELHNAALRSAYGIPLDAPLFLFVGSGFSRKGLPALLDAMREMPASAHLLVAGKDKATRGFQQQAQALGLGARIHFAGGQQDVKPFYGAADAFVFPTLYEPFGNVVLEAMAAGLPVITSSKSGAAEIVKHGMSGFVIDALDHAGLVGAMHQLTDRQRCQEMGAAARQAAEPMTLEHMGREVLKFYNSLLDQV